MCLDPRHRGVKKQLRLFGFGYRFVGNTSSDGLGKNRLCGTLCTVCKKSLFILSKCLGWPTCETCKDLFIADIGNYLFHFGAPISIRTILRYEAAIKLFVCSAELRAIGCGCTRSKIVKLQRCNDRLVQFCDERP